MSTLWSTAPFVQHAWLTPLRVAWLFLQTQRRLRQDERALRSLPDSVLHDLGIGRSEILAVSRCGRDMDPHRDPHGGA